MAALEDAREPARSPAATAYKHLVVDGLIGVGKSYVCKQLEGLEPDDARPAFVSVPEVAHIFALQPFVDMLDSTRLERVDGAFVRQLADAKSALARIKASTRRPESALVDADLARISSALSLSEARWQATPFGIFQNIMLSCSLGFVLDSPELSMESYHSSPRAGVTSVFAMDRDPVSNLQFRDRLSESGCLSPIASHMYARIFDSYKEAQAKTVETWLWCTPETALGRIALRGRDAESAIDIATLRKHQTDACERLLSVYAAASADRTLDAALLEVAEKCVGSPLSAMPSPFPPCSADGVYQYADSRPVAVVDWNDEACFGSVDLLIETHAALSDGTYKQPTACAFRLDDYPGSDLGPRCRWLPAGCDGESGSFLVVLAKTYRQAVEDADVRQALFKAMADSTLWKRQLDIAFLLTE